MSTEVPLPKERAFVFTHEGQPFGPRARTVKELVKIQRQLPVAAAAGHAQRGDFSRWVADVFGDQPLARAIRIETQYRRGGVARLSESLISSIRERYELTG
jgi:hypothetical protein